MIFYKNNLLKFLRFKFSIFEKYSWSWTYNNPYCEENIVKWKPLNNGIIKVNIDKNKVWLRSNRKFRKGWYFLCIHHIGLNRFAYGSIKNDKYLYSQGRLLSSGKKRFRVFRIIKKENPILCLANLQNELDIKVLTLFPIPSFYAWIKIKNRIKSLIKETDIILQNSSLIWGLYNRTLSKTKSKFNIPTYSGWIEKVEKFILERNKKVEKNCSKYFSWQKEGNFEFEKEKKWVIPIFDDDLISKSKLNIVSNYLKKNKKCLLLYTDEDCIDNSGKRFYPNFKTKWNLEMFLSNPNFGNSWVISSKIWNKALEISKDFNKNKDFKIVILICVFLCESSGDNNTIEHLPLVCYHSKQTYLVEPNKFPDDKYALFLKKFLKSKWNNLGNCKEVKINTYNTGYKFFWSVPKDVLISIIIPTKDKVSLLKNCINSIQTKKCGINYEILIVDNNSKNKVTLKYLDYLKNNFHHTVKVYKYKRSFNYSKINNYAFSFAKGDVILFLNNDVEFISSNWGYELFSNAIRPNIGCVGSKLLYPNNTIQHAGVVIGIHGTAGHSHKYFRANDNGYQNRISLCHEVSAVTGACMAISKEKFKNIGMFDEKLFKVNFNDVDLCLKSMELGYRNLYTPDVIAIHHESATRSVTNGYQSLTSDFEKLMLRKRWKKFLENDPLYSPYLTLLDEDFSLSYRNSDYII